MSKVANLGANKKSKKVKPCAAAGIVHVLSTFNNNIITVTDMQGNVIVWSSSGSHGFKGSRKATAYAAQTAAAHLAASVYERGMRTVTIFVRGAGSGRDAAIKAFAKFDILAIKYLVEMPYNGCRPPKRRRA